MDTTYQNNIYDREYSIKLAGVKLIKKGPAGNKSCGTVDLFLLP
jgi:hypothetical protein